MLTDVQGCYKQFRQGGGLEGLVDKKGFKYRGLRAIVAASLSANTILKSITYEYKKYLRTIKRTMLKMVNFCSINQSLAVLVGFP